MEEKKKSGLSTAGMVLGIIAICFSFIPILNYISMILGILAVIFGLIGTIKGEGRGMAIAGLILGILSFILIYNSYSELGKAVETVGNSLNNAVNEINSGTSSISDVSTSTTANAKTEYNQGEEARLGDGAITVTKVEKSNGTQWDKPNSGKEYVIVSVTIENKGSKNLSYNPFYFKMQNSQGQQESEKFTTINSDTALSSGELISGGKVSGTIAFEEPIGDTGLILVYNDSIWSSKELKINLSNE